MSWMPELLLRNEAMRKFLNDHIEILPYGKEKIQCIFINKPGAKYKDAKYYYARHQIAEDTSKRAIKESMRAARTELIDLIMKEWGIKPFECLNAEHNGKVFVPGQITGDFDA